MTFFTTLARVLIGGLFVGHGTQKLFGWFGGHGPEATGQAFEGMGMKPGKTHALAAGYSEAGGGLALALGLFTPAAGAAIIGTMVQAIRSVHGSNGPWVTEGGWEYCAVVIAATTAIVEVGPGTLSLDSSLGIDAKGTTFALAALGAGIAGPIAFQKLLPTPAEDQTPRAAADAAAQAPVA
jgi:putative oxidoreductase